jgi:hypothetical protein
VSAFSSPGTPKIRSTPSASKHFTNKSEAFIIYPQEKNFVFTTPPLSSHGPIPSTTESTFQAKEY